MILHLFLISSPLQAIVAENIKVQYLASGEDQYCIFCEGKRLVSLFDTSLWTEIIVGKNTRPSTEKPRENIKYNLKILEQHLENFEGDIVLYVSELFWLFNNVVFALLKKKYGAKIQCVFFDEGLIMYRGYELSLREKFVAILKYIWLRSSGFPAVLTTKNFVLNDSKINKVYCYHPQLIANRLMPNARKKLLPLNPSVLKFSNDAGRLEVLDSKSILFLSQPYYRVMPEHDCEMLVAEMIKYFRSQGYEKFFVKPHDADQASWLEKLSNKYGMHVFKAIQSVPIESLASSMKCAAIVSICSSALLNLKLFGYKGRVVSFGMERCNFTKRLILSHNNVKSIYQELGVEVVD